MTSTTQDSATAAGVRTLLHVDFATSPETTTNWTDIATVPDWFNLRLARPEQNPYGWAALYTASGNHDLVPVFDAMRREPHRLRQVWRDFLDSIDFFGKDDA